MSDKGKKKGMVTLKKAVASNEAVAVSRKKRQGEKSEIVASASWKETISGGLTGSVRVTIKVGFVNENYNSMQAEVGGEIPFALDDADDLDVTLEKFDEALTTFWAKVEDVANDKAGEMLETLDLVKKKG
jgi:hypothetical protein